MKVAVITFVLLAAVATEGFIFGGGCKQDSDCDNGCCVHSFIRSHCVSKSQYLRPCSLSGCGCQSGLVCVKTAEVTSVAIESQVGRDEMVCEIQQSATTAASAQTTS